MEQIPTRFGECSTQQKKMFKKLASKYSHVAMVSSRNALKAPAAAQRYITTMKTYSVQGSCAAQSTRVSFTSHTNNKTIVIGGNPKYETAETGMTPLEASLGALIACEAITARFLAQKVLNLKIGAINFVTVEGDIDVKGMSTGTQPAHFSKVKIVAEVETEESQEKITLLHETVGRYCPVYSMFKHSGTVMEGEWIAKKPAEAPVNKQ